MNAQLWTRCTVLNVVDGDTIDCEIDLGFHILTRQRLRLFGVDTPERGQPGYDTATEFVRSACLGKAVQLETYRADKYGRFLAVVRLPGAAQSVNEQLLAGGLAKPYPT